MSPSNARWAAMSEQITGVAQMQHPLVHRLLAPNPSPFTYSGTQTYLVGSHDVAVIDPGPDLPDHVEAIVRAIGGRPVRAIVCTHTHRDHSPAAIPLKERTGAPIIGCAPLVLDDLGPRADAGFDTSYAPDDVLRHGDRLSGDGWTIEAVHTPGHTSNHLCYALPEAGALFTGDHVMGWSTSVVVPPDGNMTDYMRSLEMLVERDQDLIYHPAHGEPIDRPQRFVRGMAGHRRQREGQILRLLEKQVARIPDMVASMYVGVDPRLHFAAGLSVLAHLIDLQTRGLVRETGDEWSLAA
jgi:glyoxylase-like metal-dependent hydrolase (beta-lactamase superfamily II)